MMESLSVPAQGSAGLCIQLYLVAEAKGRVHPFEQHLISLCMLNVFLERTLIPATTMSYMEDLGKIGRRRSLKTISQMLLCLYVVISCVSQHRSIMPVANSLYLHCRQ